MKRVYFLLVLVAALTGCDTGLQTMGTTEYGVRFRVLPRFLGGGVGSASSVILPLETGVVMPWEEVYRFDTSPQYLSWGKGATDGGDLFHVVENEDVHTRARDGNEADLKITARYRIKPDPESLVKLAQEVAISEDEIRKLVIAAVRSDVRSHMNRLKTVEFRDDKKRNKTIDAATEAVRGHLSPLGIQLEAITLKEYRFVRALSGGREDTSYQDRLRDIQEREQDIEGERSRVETVRGKKQKELQEAQSEYNSRIAEAEGYKAQAIYEGDGYFTARSNEAKAILAEGTAEVEGLKQQMAALSGKGGRAMLRLEVAKQLAKANPKFVTLGEGNNTATNGASIGVSRTDMNQLIQQLGVLEGLAGQVSGDAASPRSVLTSQGTTERKNGEENGK
jgi:regulator of protease activity HflC (stomatin/prohibitin superfamily)